jgi:hypothetical protein
VKEKRHAKPRPSPEAVEAAYKQLVASGQYPSQQAVAYLVGRPKPTVALVMRELIRKGRISPSCWRPQPLTFSRAFRPAPSSKAARREQIVRTWAQIRSQ